VICLDSSVALAHLFAEDRKPPGSVWEQKLIASRLLQYEVWNRIDARGLGPSAGAAARELIDRVDLIELAPPVLARALQPFPVPVRRLDALHLASIEFIRSLGVQIELASYDLRLNGAARALGVELLPI